MSTCVLGPVLTCSNETWCLTMTEWWTTKSHSNRRYYFNLWLGAAKQIWNMGGQKRWWEQSPLTCVGTRTQGFFRSLTLQAGDTPSHSLAYTTLHSTDRSAHRKRQIFWGHVPLSNSLFTKHRMNFRKQSVRFVVTVFEMLEENWVGHEDKETMWILK